MVSSIGAHEYMTDKSDQRVVKNWKNVEAETRAKETEQNNETLNKGIAKNISNWPECTD